MEKPRTKRYRKIYDINSTLYKNEKNTELNKEPIFFETIIHQKQVYLLRPLFFAIDIDYALKKSKGLQIERPLNIKIFN